MAINYYCSIALQGSNLEFNKNQLIQPVMENSAAQPASPVEGQMYFDTTVGDKTMYFYNGTAWIEMDGTGSGVTSFTNANGTFISATANTSATGAVTMGTIDLSASGSPDNTKFLRGDNVWATPAGAYSSWSLEADLGSAVDITDGLRVDFTGGTGISTTVASATPNTLTIDLADTAVTPGAYTNASLTVDAQGRLTAASSGTAPVTNVTAGDGLVETGAATTPTISVDYAGAGNVIDAASSGTTIVTADKILYEDATDTTVKEIAVSSLIALAPNTQETYTLPVAAGGGNSAVLNLTAGGSGSGVKSSVTINGTTNEVEISESTGNNGSVTVGLPNSVVLATALTINGTGASALNIGSGKAQTAATTGSDPDATLTTKGYVDGLVSGGLTFKGTFRADSGLILSGDNNGSYIYNCPGGAGTRVAVSVGDYYVVATAGGSFYCSGDTLDIGDSIIGVTASAADNSVVGDWSIVQSDEGVVSFTNANGTYVSASTVNTNATGAVTMGTIDLSAVDGTSTTSTRFLSKNNTWAVPSYTTARAAGIGLSLNGNTIDANVDGTQTVAANASSSTASRTYKVQVDASDKLVVNVPWSDTTGAVTSVDESTSNNQKGIIVNPTTGAVKVGLNIVGQTELTSLVAADDFLVYDASTTTNKRVGFDVLKAAVDGNETITLSGDVEGSGTTAITTTITADAVEASMLNNNVISGQTAIGTVVATDELLISDAGTIKRADVSQLADVIHASNGYAVTLTSFGNVTHNLNSFDVVVQLYDDTTKETVQACVDRTSVNVVAVSGSSFPAGNIRVLVSKVS